MSTSRENAVERHYSRPDLTRALESWIRTIRSAPDALNPKDVAPGDEFHLRGRTATRELARQAGLTPGTTVLDLGSGLGGPARTLAREWECQVVGIDLTAAYVEAARTLTEQAGLEGRVTFRHGTVLDLPFEASCFDVVWLQHVSMNVEDKRTLFSEVHRVLRPGGLLVIHEIGAGPQTPLHHPVPWADDPSLSFLLPPTRLRDLIEESGFLAETWSDTSAECRAWFRENVSSQSERSTDASPSLLRLLMGKNASQKQRNVIRNLDENRIVVLQGLAQRPTD